MIPPELKTPSVEVAVALTDPFLIVRLPVKVLLLVRTREEFALS